MAKKNDQEHPIVKVLPGITLVIASLVTISNFVNKDFLNLNIWVVLAFLLVCWLYSLYLGMPQKPTAKAVQQKKQRVLLKYLSIIGIPILMIAISVFRFERPPRCADPGTLVIGVANFEDANPSQDFSTELISSLKEKSRSNNEKLSVKYIPSFFDLKDEEDVLFKKLKESAKKNCINQGLIIYGRWVEKKNYQLYRGYFFIPDGEEYRKSFSTHPVRILDSLGYDDIKMPQEFKFEMPKYVDSLANTALAIMKFYGGAFAEARKLLEYKDVAKVNSLVRVVKTTTYLTLQKIEQEENGLKAIHEFYLATIDLIEGDISSAKSGYFRSYGFDASNDNAIENYQYLNRIMEKLEAETETSDSLPLADNNSLSRVSSKSKKTPADEKKKPKNDVTDKSGPSGNSTQPTLNQKRETPLIEAKDTVGQEDDPKSEIRETVITAMGIEEVLVDEFSSLTYEKKTFQKVIIFTKEGKFGIRDANHQVLTNRLYDEIIPPGSEGCFRVTGDRKVGFITLKGRPVTPLKYDGARDFQEGMAAVQINGKWGFIERNGVEVIKCQYENVVTDFIGGTAVVSNGGKKGIRIDKHGRKVRTERLN